MMSARLGDAFVGVDVYGAAQSIAKRAMSDCDGRNAPKTISIIDGPGNDPASILWNQGIKDVVEQAGYKVLVAHSQFQNVQAQAAAESVLQQQQGKLCGFMVTFDLNSITVGQTVKAAESRGQVQPGSVGGRLRRPEYRRGRRGRGAEPDHEPCRDAGAGTTRGDASLRERARSRGARARVLDFYTGSRWGELVGQQRHECSTKS